MVILFHNNLDELTCQEGETQHGDGDIWYKDSCTVCVCRGGGGGVHCSPITCPPLDPIVGCKEVSTENGCCPLRVCRHDGEFLRVCVCVCVCENVINLLTMIWIHYNTHFP